MENTSTLFDSLVSFANDYMITLLVIGFFVGIIFRALVYYTIKREYWFCREFEKRVQRFIDADDHTQSFSFFILAKKLLERTYYECFEVRAIMKRRNPDFVMGKGDRAFLIQAGAAWLVRDTLKHIRYLKFTSFQPKIMEITRGVFKNNPCFNRLLGIIPLSSLNSILGTLPGLFIIGGIFGTFLGITDGLSDLTQLDLNNVEGARQTMNKFLGAVSFSMRTSIYGIMLSVTMTIINSLLSPERVFVETVERYENALDIIWNRSDNNKLPKDIADFDENRDAIEALAEETINKELEKRKDAESFIDRPRESEKIQESEAA